MAHAHEHGSQHQHGGHDHAGHQHGSHGHGPHTHGQDASERRLLVALAILGLFTLVEAVGGFLANSIALLAEAAHMLADSASLLLAIIAIRVGRRPADARRTYGHRRYQPLAAFVNGQLLILLTFGVAYEAIIRLLNHSPVDARLMLPVALIGGVANLVAFMALSGARSLNERGARAHVLSDLLGSVAASAAAILILTKGWNIADPLLSLLLAVLILRSGWQLMRESADVLLETVPAGFDVARVSQELVRSVPGLVNVHDVHIWSITGERPMVTLHADLTAGSAAEEALTAIHKCLHQSFNIEHCTVQIERDGRCETPENVCPRSGQIEYAAPGATRKTNSERE